MLVRIFYFIVNQITISHDEINFFIVISVTVNDVLSNKGEINIQSKLKEACIILVNILL